MNRQIVYIGAIPQDTDFLNAEKNAMISDGWLAQAVLGTSTLFSGLACSPTSPAGLTVNVAPGCVFSNQNVDNSAYGSLVADTTHQIMKIGISLGTTNLSCPAPATTGYSVVYLVEAAFQENDGGSTVLPYYNAAQPSMPWAGPNNTGVSQNTVRQDQCIVQVKAGVPALTGTQVTPSPDAGFSGLWAVTVANGQTQITSANIVQVGNAPFISETLTQKISQTTADARYTTLASFQNAVPIFFQDSSGSPNTITGSVTPNLTNWNQIKWFLVQPANTNTGSTVVNLNGLGNRTIKLAGNNLSGGEMVANNIYLLANDGTNIELLSNSSAGLFTINIQKFSSSGTYTPTPGMAYCLVKMIGGGASGIGVINPCAGGGGGAGAYNEGVFSAATIGASQTITIGAGGTSNGAGGNTSLGSLMTAPGAAAAPTSAAASSGSSYLFQGGPGGVAGSGGINATGASGQPGNYTNIGGAVFTQAGKGADSPFGTGGLPALITSGSANGSNASGYGSGGGGASSASGTPTGGNGAPGYVEIIEYCI